MSSFEDHFGGSIQRLKKDHAGLYAEHGAILQKMLAELHLWLDFFAGQTVGKIKYTGGNYIKHRQERHHVEGISEAVRIFSAKYGEEFAGLIREEAERHVCDDMGEIYFAADYRRIGFWKQARGF